LAGRRPSSSITQGYLSAVPSGGTAARSHEGAASEIGDNGRSPHAAAPSADPVRTSYSVASGTEEPRPRLRSQNLTRLALSHENGFGRSCGHCSRTKLRRNTRAGGRRPSFWLATLLVRRMVARLDHLGAREEFKGTAPRVACGTPASTEKADCRCSFSHYCMRS
jgi:hypothetical protein